MSNEGNNFIVTRPSDVRPFPQDRAKLTTPTGGDGGNIDDMERLAKIEALLPTLATKVDAAELRADFAELRSDVRTEASALRGDFAGMQRLFAADRTAHVKWIVITVSAAVALLLSFMSYFARQPTERAAISQQQPTVIVVPPYSLQQAAPAASPTSAPPQR